MSNEFDNDAGHGDSEEREEMMVMRKLKKHCTPPASRASTVIIRCNGEGGIRFALTVQIP